MSYTHTINDHSTFDHHHNKLHHTFVGAVLALTLGQALAAEPLISEAEFPTTRKAICTHNKLPTATPADIRACESFVAERKNKLTDGEKIAAINGACFQRHKTHHISFYQACQGDLMVQYKLATAAVVPPSGAVAANNNNNDDDKPTALGACAKGAAVGVGTGIVIHVVAAALDIFGCAGACTATAATWTLPAAGAAAAGCAGGVVTHAVESAAGAKSGDTPQRPPQPRPQPK